LYVPSDDEVAIVRVRFGIAFALGSFGALIGNPVDGALLGETFPWIRPVTFSGVGLFLYIKKLHAHASIGSNLDIHNWLNYHSPNACSQKRYTICLMISYHPYIPFQVIFYLENK